MLVGDIRCIYDRAISKVKYLGYYVYGFTFGAAYCFTVKAIKLYRFRSFYFVKYRYLNT